ncbi:sensor histidine kinase [Pseudoxanthomonas sp. UTMC 1351]|uniref:sensor histidine kinase n=1 Tax=Pseudoxanthomonas sp. UTMC 1351 TaxID=2695853 RepID=UPI0034D02258
MLEFFRRLREPMTLAGLFTVGAVALSLQFVPASRLFAAVVVLSVFTVLFATVSTGPEHWQRTRHAALVLMPIIALVLTWVAPLVGTAQVLLVIWTACAFRFWPPRWAIAAVLLVDVAFYLLMADSGFNSPAMMVLINMGFQALAALCVYYAVTAERSRDLLARVNADLLATRALLSDSARGAERLRVARELHDVAGHKLTAMKLNLRALAADPALAGHPEVKVAEQLSTELLDDIRNVVQALRDSRGLDLEMALRALAAPLPRPRLQLDIDPYLCIVDPTLAETLLRVVQEALTNAAKHAHADTLWVQLSAQENGVVLKIEDDGQLRGAVREGNGLCGMRERVAALGGDLLVRTRIQGGLQLQARFPA